MALALVGGSLLSASLQVLFDRMATPGFEGIKDLFRKRNHDEELLKKLKRNLKFVEAVLDDAENKETTNKPVKEWLDDVRDTFNQAEDLLDKINTEALRLKIETEYHQTPTNKVSASPYALPSMDKLLNYLMPEIEKIVPRLEEFQKQIQPLGLQVGMSQRQSLRKPSTSLVDGTSVFGRDADVENIIPMLLSEDTNGDSITVVPIVGLGGIGKTTLAQMVYKDVRVTEHFSIRAWVCISEEYDVTRITKELLRELHIPFSDSDDSLNSLGMKLQVGFNEKKFLLVLDDVWNRDYNSWVNLMVLFKGGSRGSKIIVTTRDQKVARMMGKEESIHELGLISKEACWSLFEKHAFENIEGNRIPELEEIGKKIVRKCRGLPLAVKTVAGLLRSETMAKEWEDVLTSEEWSQTDGILPSLRLSYIHLPPQLKRCFAYCAVFHKDYQFKKEEIIQLWQANDLLGYPGDNERRANWGEKCFHELRMRSFFQRSTNDLFSMHDLVNDLARFVSGEYCIRLEDHQEGHGTISRVSHFSYHPRNYDTYHKFQLLREAKHLKTFQPIRVDKYGFADCSLSGKFLRDMLPSFKSLRSLSLSSYKINELPDPIRGLKQLRFLDLSYTQITNLPDWICTLCNLQTLLLSGCYQIQELPTDLRKLINLFYLDISRIPLKKMPSEMGRLRNLQVLTAFVVGKDSGSPIEELGKFPMLRGKLFLSGLENVPRSTDASMANMKGKKNIESLTLKWEGDTSDSQSVRNVLDALQPHSNIKHLKINRYCGTTFSDWLGNSSSLCNLESLRLYRCEYCFCLPALGQLQNLQSLEIVGMSNIFVLTEDLYGDTSAIKPPFPSLKKFKIEKMKELEKWHIPAECCEVFCSLEELCIIDCPKLTGELPKQLLSRGRLEISGCNKLVLLNSQQLSSSLCELEISNDENRKELCGELNKLDRLEKLNLWKDNWSRLPFPMSCLPSSLKSLKCEYANLELESESSWQGGTLEILELSYCHCDSLKDISLASFPMLKSLSISNCESIEKMLSIPPPRQTTGSRLTSLQSLGIMGCDDLVSFPEGGLPAPNLMFIYLSDCEKLKSLPERMESLLPSLRHLFIIKCPEIECFPEGGLPFSLQSLSISNCKKLVSRRREWGLQRLPSLRSFGISDLDEVEKDLLPCTLEFLSIGSIYSSDSNRNLKMLNNLGHLTSLKELCVSKCPLLKSLPEERLPASLTTLRIYDCRLLKSLPEERLPASLTTLEIFDCPLLECLPEEGLPASLTTLKIIRCPLLKSLPEEGLPASLTTLHIRDCSLLKPRLKWEKGQDWHKVAHIPCVIVDGKLVP